MHDEQPSEDARSQKTFILDTSILLFDPDALNVFQDSDLVSRITVIEEIDPFKKDLNEDARMVSRHLDALRKKSPLADGVPRSGGGNLRVRIPSEQTSLPGGFSLTLTGNPNHIDNPYVDATSSGLSHVAKRSKESPIAGHITLRKGERSEFTELATRHL
jgi:predicted ribonuclease YlaK